MSVPVAVAVPLLVYLTLVPRLPPSESPLLATDGRMFVTGTLAGVPMIACVMWIGTSVVRRRWWGLVGLAGVVVIATSGRGRMDLGGHEVDGRNRALWVGGMGIGVVGGGVVAAVLWGFHLMTPGYGLVRRRAAAGVDG